MPTLTGHLKIRAAVDGEAKTYIAEQSFCSPFHLGKAYWEGSALIINVVNATAGILEGDSLTAEVAVGKGAAVLLTAPAASRAFTMKAKGAACRQDYSVAAGGWLEVMPEPLVPHREARYLQETSLSVEKGGELYFVDILAPGRTAHGEGWEWKQLQIDLALRWGGELIFRERTQQTGQELIWLADLAGMDKPWFASILLVSEALEEEEGWRKELHTLHGPALRIGFSRLRPGAWVGRLVAANPLVLRQALVKVRTRLQALLPRLTVNARKI